MTSSLYTYDFSISEESKEYKTLFGSDYWLASSFTWTGPQNAIYGLLLLNTKRVWRNNTYNSDGQCDNRHQSCGVRAIVHIKPDIQLTGGTGDSKENAYELGI